jgi:hypothetical protein
MDRKAIDMATTATSSSARRVDRRDDSRPRIPFRDQVRSLTMLDGSREITIDRRCIGFLCPVKDAPDTATVVGLRLAGAKPVPVRTPYAELKKWWLGLDANGKT